MKNRPLTLILLLTLCSFSYAQEFGLGLKGGFNYYNIGDINSRGGSIMSGKPDEVFTPNRELGHQFGAFLNVAIDKFFIRPEVNFVTNNNSYDFPNRTSNWKVTKTDIPILLGYKVYDPIGVYVGPNFSFFNDMTIGGANNNTAPNTIDFYKSTTGFIVGLQVEFKRFGVDLRYETGYKETVGEHEDNYQDFQNSAYGINIADIYPYKPSQISLNLNIFLFRTDGEDIKDIFSDLFRGNRCNCYLQ